jgi:hypothetical protein
MTAVRSARTAALALALAAASACAEIDTGPHEWSYDGPVNSCKGGCAEGSCDPGLSVCAVDPPADRVLIARVVPASSTGVPPQAFAIDAGAGAPALVIAAPVAVTAKTLAGEDDDIVSLRGRVIFSDVGNRLPGRPARVTVYEAYNTAALDLALVPGLYDILVIPGGAQATSFPIYYLDGVTIGTDGALSDSDGGMLDIVVPPAAATVTGRIMQASAPVNGLEVVALDSETGRTVSTSDTTACVTGGGDQTVCGHFSIELAKSAVAAAATFSLRVSRASEANHPVFTAEGFTAPAEGETLDLSGDARLAFGPLGVPIRTRVRVLKPVTSAAGALEYDPAPSCFVALRSADVAGGSVETWVLTDESGEIEDAPGIVGINLYPGDYGVTVIPSHAAIGAFADYEAYTAPGPLTVSEGSADEELVVRLASRPVAVGSVTAGGSAVPTSAVFAEPGVGAATTARPNSGIAGGSGRFHLWLDEAPYVVAAEAPEESRYAWDLTAVTVSGAQAEVDLELPVPFVLRGTVATSAAQLDPIDLTGAVVEWYREVDGRAYAVGRTAVGADGAFAALLSP